MAKNQFLTLEKIAEELGMPGPVLLSFTTQEGFPESKKSSSKKRM
jgi:hypothetical protein